MTLTRLSVPIPYVSTVAPHAQGIKLNSSPDFCKMKVKLKLKAAASVMYVVGRGRLGTGKTPYVVYLHGGER